MEESVFTNEIKRALLEWKAAENFLESVHDPDLIECAIYDLEAAKRRYAYMIKQMKKEPRSLET